MDAEVRHLSLDEVMALHDRMMSALGWHPAPLRSVELLESAVLRPQTAAYYERADLVRQAALLGVGISQAQAYLDGNKRTAYIAMVAFLELNHIDLLAEPLVVAQQLNRVSERSDSLDAATARFEAWLRQNVLPAS